METLKSTLILTLSSFLIFASCSKGGVPTDRKDIELTKAQKEIVGKGNKFALNLYKELTLIDKDKNVFISPLSATLALAAITTGASGETLNEMKSALGFEGLSLDEMNGFYKKLTPSLLEVDKKCKVKIANALWLNINFKPLNSFTKTLSECYYTDVRTLDFQTTKAVPTINRWCSDNTNGLIDNIIDEIMPNVKFLYTNALYFKGTWSYEFEKSESREGTFNNFDSSKSTVTYMGRKGSYRCNWLEEVSVIEIPYGNKAYSMVVILPDEGISVLDIVSRLTPERLTQYTSFNMTSDLYLTMPRFEVKYDTEEKMIGALMEMGIKAAFTPTVADFSGITGSRDLFISLVKQKTFIKTDEKGSEAAAVTIIAGEMTAMPSGLFTINRPFIYMIKEQSTDTILFIGTYLSAK